MQIKFVYRTHILHKLKTIFRKINCYFVASWHLHLFSGFATDNTTAVQFKWRCLCRLWEIPRWCWHDWHIISLLWCHAVQKFLASFILTPHYTHRNSDILRGAMLLGTLSSQGEGGRSEPLNVRLGLLCRRPNTAICTGSQIGAEPV